MEQSLDDPILEVRDLVTSFATERGLARAVDGVSFSLRKGQTLGIVGESGCGKSVTALSIMRLLPKPAGRIEGGSIRYREHEITALPAETLHRIRGKQISMVFQEPMSALNPVHKIGWQLAEVYQLHYRDLGKQEIRERSVELLRKVGIPAPERRINEYPHHMSGGMRQRVVIALALACEPEILIADEPTTALDVTIQAQILDLIKSLQTDNGMSVILITHDLGVIAQVSDDVLVMYGGRIVENAPVRELFANPRHPYTRGLIDSIPRLDSPGKSKLKTIDGTVPSLFEMPAGCRFQNRCPYVREQCQRVPPDMERVTATHMVRCYRWRELT